MTLYQYLDARFCALSLEIQKDYTIAKDAELKATYSIIQWQRSILKYLLVPFILLAFLKNKLFPAKAEVKDDVTADAKPTAPTLDAQPKADISIQ